MAKTNRTRHVLAWVSALLIASGCVRLAVGMGPAIAFAQEQSDEPKAEVPGSSTPAVEPLIMALQARELRIAQREVALDDRLHALSVAEEEITKRLAEMEAAETSLSEILTLSETANDDDIARLTSVYENMKPADAANLFEQMAPDFASGFLVRMRPEAAAPIFAGLDPQTAYTISAIIAGRNASVPTQ